MHIPAYRLKARIQNNRLWRALTEQFPDLHTQRDLAQAVGMTEGHLGAILNIKTWPCRVVGRTLPTLVWRPVALKLAAVTGLSVDYLFDPALYGQSASLVVRELDAPQLRKELEIRRELPEVSTPETLLAQVQSAVAIERALNWLTPVQRRVLRLRFGFEDGQDHTREEIGTLLGVSAVRVAQIEALALRRLRFPRRSRYLRAMADGHIPWRSREKPPSIGPRDIVLDRLRVGMPSPIPRTTLDEVEREAAVAAAAPVAAVPAPDARERRYRLAKGRA